MESIIKLDKVKKYYELGEVIVPAVNGISLDIRKGEFIAIMGASGSGKSTLMNLIGTLDVPTTGNIFLNKINLEGISESELAQLRGKKLGFIFQTFNLVRSLNTLENVMLPLAFQNIPREVRREKAISILNQVGLGKRLNHLPSELSGGEMQRVAIARALVNDPEIILADEPTGNLDSKTGREIINLLDSLNKKGKTIILITHDNEVAKSAQRVVKIKDGKLLK